MDYDVGVARPDEFLDIAALDRIAWPESRDTFIPDGEHIWRVWCDHAVLLAARVTSRGPLTATNHVAGALVMFPTVGHELVLHKIMVHPVCRGHGIGSALMRHALQQADAPVLLTVDPDNAPAIGLYENFGFRQRERIDGYYRPHEHRLIMVFEPDD